MEMIKRRGCLYRVLKSWREEALYLCKNKSCGIRENPLGITTLENHEREKSTDKEKKMQMKSLSGDPKII